MKVGTIVKLKVACLQNKAGALGVVFNDYGDGFQAIFKNGGYDGFSLLDDGMSFGATPNESEYFLEEVGFEKSLAGYQFKNVMQVSTDYRNGLFNIAWSENRQAAPTLLDCCKRYIRAQEDVYKEMGKKPTSTMYRMMKEAVAEAEK